MGTTAGRLAGPRPEACVPTPTSQDKGGRVERGVTCGQAGVGVVARFVVVVLDVEAGELRVLYAESAARVVDVLAVQLLKIVTNVGDGHGRGLSRCI